MRAIPTGQAALAGFMQTLFPDPVRSGLIVRQLQPPDSPAVTVVYLQDLVAPSDLERLVLVPLAGGGLQGAPPDLARSGRFPAPFLATADDAGTLRARLLDGVAAIHVDGHPSVLLVGSGESVQSAAAFGHDLDDNRIILSRCLRRADLIVEELSGAPGTRPLLMYLKSTARPALLKAVRQQIGEVTQEPSRMPPWRALVKFFRIPPVFECTSPSFVAAALRRGYVAVLVEHSGGPYLAPTTLELLLRGPKDESLPVYLQRLSIAWRLMAAFHGMTLGAWLVAISAYHVAVIPGPFLMAIAVSRQNMPFPIVAEMFLVSFLGDVAEAAAIRSGGQRVLVLAWIGTILALTAAMQVGVIGAISGLAAIAATALRLTLPNETLRRTLRAWRYAFLLAASGLGVYGISLLGFAMLVYLGQEQAFGQPLRLAPDGMTQ